MTTKLEVLADPRTIAPAFWTRTAAKLRERESSPLGVSAEQILRAAESPELLAELQEQLALSLKVRDAISGLSGTVEQLRAVRAQLVARNELLRDDARAKTLVKASREVLLQLDALEEKLHNPKAKIVYDILAQKGGARLYSQLAWLFEMLKDSDGTPTQGLREVFAEQSELLRKYQEEWTTLQKRELAALNERAKKLNAPGILIPPIAKD